MDDILTICGNARQLIQGIAGMIIEAGLRTGLERMALRIEMRNPSVAAMVKLLSEIVTETPCRTGRASSVEAAKCHLADDFFHIGDV